MLTVVDEYIHQALAVHVACKVSSSDAPEALYPIVIKHRKPRYARYDNGHEFIAEVVPN